ncbi:MAG TPA: SDR family oxidoreductase [Paracoccus sp. (in: a-proteobacteria)]|uniref:SDR family NAD(P)-dependent oxidoreductase n=1 Tax=uncultured Paracoccus sp. TaxID=189685 RepID=UPI0026055595|nr:SDR family oxidoreductase [uncultured Paracoccus sp.]HMQ42318.1 SDR family oxidoreductase [Paracoccus sp. (in: a-proteobacteria)]HMR35999.1 SDR family oxidoreductase [Paracoccus sp. (in: a-proteobacteria)]
MSNSVEGKTAIVTGAGQGIGLAIARQLREHGANVMFADCDEAALEHEMTRFGEDTRVRHFAADMSQRLSMANLLSATIDAFDRVDILVNAHRMVKPGDPLEAIENGLEEMLRQNLLAGLMMSKIVAKRMIQQAKDSDDDRMAGAIVNLTTLAAQRPHPELMAYSIASAAQDQATRALALVLAPQRIRVNSVAFGSVMTAEMQRMLKENPDLRDGIIKGTPMGRIAESEELADAVLYLVGDGAGFVTGQILNVDGGRSLLDPVQAAMF